MSKTFYAKDVPVYTLGKLSEDLGQELKKFKQDINSTPDQLLNEIKKWCSNREFDKIVWVPSNKFTHTMPWFASKIAEICNSKAVESISFTRKVKEQKLIESYEERKVNVQSAFQIDGSLNPSDRILLIDDVYASGSTITELVTILQELNFTNIEILVFVYRDN